MKVTVEIPDETIAELMAITGATTPAEAVVIAIDEYVMLMRKFRADEKAA